MSHEAWDNLRSSTLIWVEAQIEGSRNSRNLFLSCLMTCRTYWFPPVSVPHHTKTWCMGCHSRTDGLRKKKDVHAGVSVVTWVVRMRRPTMATTRLDRTVSRTRSHRIGSLSQTCSLSCHHMRRDIFITMHCLINCISVSHFLSLKWEELVSLSCNFRFLCFAIYALVFSERAFDVYQKGHQFCGQNAGKLYFPYEYDYKFHRKSKTRQHLGLVLGHQASPINVTETY